MNNEFKEVLLTSISDFIGSEEHQKIVKQTAEKAKGILNAFADKVYDDITTLLNSVDFMANPGVSHAEASLNTEVFNGMLDFDLMVEIYSPSGLSEKRDEKKRDLQAETDKLDIEDIAKAMQSVLTK